MADADDKWQLLLFPESASSVSGQVDTLFWAMVVACGLVVALVFTVLLVFGIRYRRGSPASRRGSPLLYHNRWLEIGWSIPVLAAFLSGQIGDFGRNAAVILALPFFLMGLSVIHAASNRWPGRIFFLLGIYLFLFAAGWPAAIVVALGVFEPWTQLRTRFAKGPREEEEE